MAWERVNPAGRRPTLMAALAAALAMRRPWRPLSEQVPPPPVTKSVARFDPEPTSAVQLFCAAKSLLNHLVGVQQDRLRHSKAERLGSLEVHGHLEFCRKLHRQLRRLCAA